MGKKNEVRSKTLPLAWLESYLAVYKHCDAGLAADECGRTVDVIEDHVEKLSKWLHRLLVGGSGRRVVPAEPHPPFIATTADKILRSFDQVLALIKSEAPPTALSLASSPRSEVTLFQLEVISALHRGVGIDKAAYLAGRTGRTGRREIGELQRLIGCNLVRGSSYTKFTNTGETFALVAESMSALLYSARADIDEDEVLKDWARKRQGVLVRELMIYDHFHRVISAYDRPSKDNLDLLVEIEGRARLLREELAKSREQFGPLPRIVGFEEDLPSFYKFTRRRSACGKRIILSSKPIRSISSTIREVSFLGVTPARNQRGRFVRG